MTIRKRNTLRNTARKIVLESDSEFDETENLDCTQGSQCSFDEDEENDPKMMNMTKEQSAALLGLNTTEESSQEERPVLRKVNRKFETTVNHPKRTVIISAHFFQTKLFSENYDAAG